MTKSNSFSPYLLKLFKIIATIGMMIFLTCICVDSIKYRAEYLLSKRFFEHIIFSIILLLVIIYPAKTEFFSIISGYYAVSLLIHTTNNPMGIMMYFLCISILYARGYIKNNQKIKNIIVWGVMTALILTEIRFGVKEFINGLINKIGYIFVLLVFTFFIHGYFNHIFEDKSYGKKLDLKRFGGMTVRDAQWLAIVQKKEKYQKISTEYHVSLGTVKNRMKEVYLTIGTDDRIGFLNRYYDYEILFGNEFSSKISG